MEQIDSKKIFAKPLGKIFYKYPDRYEKIYTGRFNSPTTKHFDLSTKQFNRTKEYTAFLCYPEELLSLAEKVYRKHEIFSATVRKIPEILLRQFALYSVLDEVQSTNDIEGKRYEVRGVS